ncbi:MAG: hypothetical protein P1P88_20130, partial [Bacteroidales bacterium]|nr:hypothetical protein [Bacteroidales bacterium]
MAVKKAQTSKKTASTKKKQTTKKLFTRKWDKKTKSYIFSGDNFKLPKKFENLLRKNASVISVAMRLNHEISQKIGKYWQKVETNVLEAGWIGDSLLPRTTNALIDALDFYSKNNKLKKSAEE